MNSSMTDREALIENELSENGRETPPENSLGFWAVIFLTVNATLGAGMLNIPYAFHVSGGIFAPTVIHSIHLILVIGSLGILTLLAHKSSTNSFQALTKHYCGSFIASLCSAAILLYSFGASVTYLLIIRDQLDKVFGTFYPDIYNQSWYFTGDLILFLIAFITILPLCCSKDISFLKYASFFGFLCTLYLTFLVFIEYLKHKDENNHNNGTLSSSFSHGQTDPVIASAPTHVHWTQIFNILPVLTFSYQCQLSWIPTFAQVENPTHKFSITGMIVVSMLVCFLSYSWMAVFGLLTFGPDTLAKDIMQNYDPNDIFVSVAMVLLILKTVVLFPVIMYVGRVVFEDLFKLDAYEAGNQFLIRITISSVWVLSAAMLAIYVPNISVAINYLGSLANLFVFILPGLILFRSVILQFEDDEDSPQISEAKINKSHLLASIVFIGYGTFVLAISINQTLNEQPDSMGVLKTVFYKF